VEAAALVDLEEEQAGAVVQAAVGREE